MISQRLSPAMPRLNQNQLIQAITMLARGDNVSNVVSVSSKQVGWQIAVVDRGLQTLERTGSVR